ncbi:tRNA 2-thiocytidine(32) synthetase TtcA [Uliginosibacterium gangwonense]|uniref:tRNA 2-thiocytidine(32) synthetase TtcA n=1 Tax=Uliginosibacterium gangwonense TaxID=392736 RepID=UPI00035E05E2|nr:tRNA 2-thiocytidine(32) synthetase TtcA [Uliginosibacterium gangwonense]
MTAQEAQEIQGLAQDELSNTVQRLKKRLLRGVGQAIADFGMIEEGDMVLVCCSGGKDSFALLDMLLALQKRAPVSFRVVAMNLDQRQPGFPAEVLPAYFESLGVEYKIVTEDTYSIVKEKIPEGKTTCSLCSRLRRGIIYRTAAELGATKIALGHHRDDIIETLFLNMFFGGKLKAMPPKLLSDNGQHMVIRPLAYCAENDIAKYARARAFPIIPCNLCGSQEQAQRKQIKTMLHEWERQHPGRTESIATALRNVVPSHLCDGNLFGFRTLAGSDASPLGDTVFDPQDEEISLPSGIPSVSTIQWLATQAD